jgi:hypothetical protein
MRNGVDDYLAALQHDGYVGQRVAIRVQEQHLVTSCGMPQSEITDQSCRASFDLPRLREERDRKQAGGNTRFGEHYTLGVPL